MLAFQYIDDDASLTELVSKYRQSPLLILDTEFVRTRTYYARLGLIQAYDGQTLALIDPISVGNLSEFWSLLSEPEITTVLHSCSEDLEVFARNGKCQPFRLFDSQIAASLCGFGHGLGYAKLVEQTLNITLDKGESRTDWMKRPLSDAQLNYAANDVYYLYELYPQLIQKLEDRNRLDWVFEEGERMTQGRLTPPDPEQAYLKVKNAFQLSSRQLAYLKVLAKWRLNKALKRDLAVGFVVKDHALIGLAKKQPKSLSELNKMIELTDQEKRVHGKDLLALLGSADLDNPPKPIDVLALKNGYKSSFKAIKNCLTALSEQHDIAIELLGSKRYIHEYLQWLWDGKRGEQPLLLSGWRAEILASPLAELNIS
ncbi:ribonuclease D [Shewanella atlantica]|uniref:ribonuclease D n=1 Tax=Shewanella atlantica TaxID=271099 RepID=UPI0037363DEA